MNVTRLVLIFLAVGIGLSIFGCGTTKSYAERERAYQVITDQEFRQLIDDFDTFWLMDRPARLSRWRER